MLKIVDNEETPQYDVIPTPSLQWNNLLGGGLWTDRIHTFWGNPGGGKSTACGKIMGAAQKMGYKPVIFNSEPGSWTNDFLEHCGVDVSNKILYPHANILEDIQEEALPLMRDGNKYVFLFDSINGIVRGDFFKKDDAHGGMALYARSQNELCVKLAGHLSVNHLVLFVAQQTVDVGAMQSPTVGKYGNAVEHNSCNIIKIFGSNSAKTVERNDDGSIDNREVLWSITKSKQTACTGAKGSFKFSPETAEYDTTDELIDLAARYGIIDNTSKGWYTYKGDKMRRSDLVARLSNKEQQLILDTVSSLNNA